LLLLLRIGELQLDAGGFSRLRDRIGVGRAPFTFSADLAEPENDPAGLLARVLARASGKPHCHRTQQQHATQSGQALHPLLPPVHGSCREAGAAHNAATACRLKSSGAKASGLTSGLPSAGRSISNRSPGSTLMPSAKLSVAVPKKCRCTSPGQRCAAYLK